MVLIVTCNLKCYHTASNTRVSTAGQSSDPIVLLLCVITSLGAAGADDSDDDDQRLSAAIALALSAAEPVERAASEDADALEAAAQASLGEAAAGGDVAEQEGPAAQGAAGAGVRPRPMHPPAIAPRRRTSSAAPPPPAGTAATPRGNRLRGELRGGVNQNTVLMFDPDGPNHDRPAPGELDDLQRHPDSDGELEQFSNSMGRAVYKA